MSKRKATVHFAALALLAGGIGNAGFAAAAEHEEAIPPHSHMLLLDATFAETEEGPQVTYRKCIDLASNRVLKLNAHHEHLHFGRAGEAQRHAGHLIIPTAPAFGLPWGDCAEFGELFPPS